MAYCIILTKEMSGVLSRKDPGNSNHQKKAVRPQPWHSRALAGSELSKHLWEVPRASYTDTASVNLEHPTSHWP